MSFGERATKAVEGERVKLDCCYTCCTSTTRVGWVSRVKESTCTGDTVGIATHMYGVVPLECKETVVPPICPPQGFPYGTPMVPNMQPNGVDVQRDTNRSELGLSQID